MNAPPGVRWVSGSNEVLDAGASLAVVIAVGAGTSGDWTDYLSAGFTFLVAATIATYMDVEYSVTTGELPFVFEEGAITPEDILGDAVHGQSKSKEGEFGWVKEGTLDDANDDFDLLTGGVPVDYGKGVRVKELIDGRRAVVRPKSEPTLEIQVEVSPNHWKSKIKIRYRQ